jgi:hypothetical protein
MLMYSLPAARVPAHPGERRFHAEREAPASDFQPRINPAGHRSPLEPPQKLLPKRHQKRHSSRENRRTEDRRNA